MFNNLLKLDSRWRGPHWRGSHSTRDGRWSCYTISGFCRLPTRLCDCGNFRTKCSTPPLTLYICWQKLFSSHTAWLAPAKNQTLLYRANSHQGHQIAMADISELNRKHFEHVRVYAPRTPLSLLTTLLASTRRATITSTGRGYCLAT